MRVIPWILLLSFLEPLAGASLAVLPGELQSNLAAVFNKESSAVTFTYRPEEGAVAGAPQDRRFILVQVDSNGQEIRRLGPLLDDGILGDQSARDGVYSRKFQINEKKPGTLRFAVRDEAAAGRLSASQARIEVLEHPAIQVLLKRIWARIRNQWHFHT